MSLPTQKHKVLMRLCGWHLDCNIHHQIDDRGHPMDVKESTAAQAILSYLIDHPDAEDTMEGIVEWWVLERCIRRRTAEIRSALDELTKSGLLLRKQGSYSIERYCLDRARLAEIRELVSRDSTP